jgi:hypothetical protein
MRPEITIQLRVLTAFLVVSKSDLTPLFGSE